MPRPNGRTPGFKHSEETKEKMRRAMLGRVITPEWRKRISASKKGTTYKNRGKKHHHWKGNQASIKALHDWVRYHKGKALSCEDCGIDKIPEGNVKYFEWANISGEYRRDLNDFKALCRSCHAKLDKIITHLNKGKDAKAYQYKGCRPPSNN